MARVGRTGLALGLVGALAMLLVSAGAAAAGETIEARNNSAKCLHKKYNHFDNGNPIHLWDCAAGGPGNKTWDYDTDTGYIHSAENPAKCLHKKYNHFDNGNPIHLWDCAAGEAGNKTWDYDPATGFVRARGNNAKCFHKKYGDWNNGNPIHLWDCAAGPADNKTWRISSAAAPPPAPPPLDPVPGDLIEAMNNPAKCLHKKYNHFDNGNPIHLWDCAAGGPGNKTWAYDPDSGYIHSAENPATCLHKKYNHFDNGNPIHLWDCDAGGPGNKTWDYDPGTGYIMARENNAKCFHKKFGDWNNGNPVHLWDCAAGPADNKTWRIPSVSAGNPDPVTFEVERLSDTQAIINASGSFSPDTPAQRGARVMLIAPMTQVADGAADVADNTMASTTGSKLTSADTSASTFRAGGQTVQVLRLVFDLNHAQGDGLDGRARLRLPAGSVFEPVGSTGDTWYGNDNSANLLTQTGQWTMVASTGAVAQPQVFGHINLRGGLGGYFDPNRGGTNQAILWGAYNWAAKYRSFLTFDAASFSAAQWTKAILRIQVSNLDGADAVNFGRLTADTWGFYGGVPDPRTGTADVATVQVDQDGFYEVDVTTAVQYWLQNPAQNFGWMIWKSNEGGGSMILHKDDGSTVAPTLTLF